MTQVPIDIGTPIRRSQIWPLAEADVRSQETRTEPRKKKSGFAKIWGIVTRSSKNDSQTASRDMSQSFERTEDDLPLAPPPPLSYLVDRGPGDLAIASARHSSTPSLPSSTSPKNVLSSPGISPPTAPSSILPSPVSSPRPGDLDNAHEGRKTSGNYDDQERPGSSPESGNAFNPRHMHPGTPEPDVQQQHQLQQRAQRSPSSAASHLTTPRPIGAARPASSMSREKSLPPLPGEALSHAPVVPPDPRPRTLYTYDPRRIPAGTALDFLPPQAPFRTADVRRQSFGGMASRPNLAIQTTPVSKPIGPDLRRSFGPAYDEFGLSRRSLARLEHVQEDSPLPIVSTPNSKRKSRFGFASLLGKNLFTHERGDVHESGPHQFPLLGKLGSDGQHEVLANGYATTTSRHSTLGGAAAPRMSVMSRKAVEELVAQDPEFVAYRYPSGDQSLDLLR